MYFGFKGFCEDFLSRHPGYTIYPIRLNGSAVESFFSKLKYNTSANLSGVNYASARATILTRGSVQGKKRNVDYRDAPMYLRTHKLQKLKYGRK